jgi:glutaredoxin
MITSASMLQRRLRALPLGLALLASGGVAAGAVPAQAAEGGGASAAGATASSSARQQALARHLKLQGAVVYGAWWCPHCNHQKELFGAEAIELLPYVECDKDDAGRKRCQAAQIRAYPTWELNGQRRLGVLSLEELEVWSGYNAGTRSSR